MLALLVAFFRHEFASCCLFGLAAVSDSAFRFPKGRLVTFETSNDSTRIDYLRPNMNTSVCLFYDLALDSLHS